MPALPELSARGCTRRVSPYGARPVSLPYKVAWISCVGEKGGAESLMLECIRELDRREFEPHVIQLRPGPLEELIREAGAVPHVLPLHRMREFHRVAGAIWRIRELARREGFRLLHSNGFRAHVYGGLAARLAGLPEVWTTHTIETPGWSTRSVLRIPTRKVLANCPRTEAFFRDAGLPTTLIWPGVNIATLEARAARAPRPVLAAKFGLPLDRPWLAMSGRLQRYKGQLDFLEALAGAKASAATHAIIIGGSLFGAETEYERELRARASTLGLQGRVTFTGFASDDELAGLLSAADLVVHPARHEDFGLSVAEAQALGVPVLAYAEVGPAAILRHGETGWLTPVGDVARLTELLGQILADPHRMKVAGRAGRIRVLAEFGAQEHARRTMDEYRKALDS